MGERMIEILSIIISSLTMVLVAYINYRANVDRKKADERAKKDEEREKLRERENRLSMQMVDADMQLSIVSANALTNGHNNGNVEAARKAAEEARRAYQQFLTEVAAHEISK